MLHYREQSYTHCFVMTCLSFLLLSRTSSVLTFACFMDILIHGAGRTAVLRATKSSRLKESSGKLANTGLVVKFTTRVDRTALHVFARKLAREARMFSLWEKKKLECNCQYLGTRMLLKKNLKWTELHHWDMQASPLKQVSHNNSQ